ncbi:radical SAM family heme chaperone HemW [Sedimenticola hydrogenitrophicus]|uniref:radical SAM family heme chaperone HemW n=1 Tax=Sedimenticola hydrogenitrophicus TaxID=2967975 RepID=UPI0021A62F8F|nr:radical SAM family heme chaperone HemW [Sedimenticola hydrogenitrophicus]
MSQMPLLPPLGLYIHLPWCVRKCPYCDFNSHEARTGIPEAAYIEALLADLDFELAGGWARMRELQSIFIGGGTPSLFSAESIQRLLRGVRERISCVAGMEVTLEANPGTLEHGRYLGYRQAGVNRLSIGVQSFQQDSLVRLGRIHGPEEVHAAIDSARSARFESVNLDLMCGLPGQTLAMAGEDVRLAIDAAPDHISYYQLTLEPNTPFHRQSPRAMPGEDAAADLQAEGRRLLAAAGYRQYEVSAYAHNGRVCRHNLNYWQFGDYIGIGAGAHGKLTSAPPWQVRRRWRVKRPEEYLRGAGRRGALSGESRLDGADLFIEFMMNTLRLKQGFAVALFAERTGLDEAYLWGRLANLLERGMLLHEAGTVRTSEAAWLFLDDVVGGLL